MKTRRLVLDRIFFTLTGLCTAFAMGLFGFLLFAIAKGGWSRLDRAFLTLPTVGGPTGGGIAYQIIGSAILIVATAAIVTPSALGLGLFVTVLLKRTLAKRTLLTLLHVLNATPSIVFGLMGYVIFIQILGWEKSWLAGAVILALMVLPTVTVAVIDRLETLPGSYVDAAKALGLKDEHVLRAVALPYARGGLLTGLIMGLARAAGETAPIMFTAVVFSGATMPSGVTDSPVLALPYHIFNLAQDIFGTDTLPNAWATATVLVGLVMLVNVLAIPLRAKSHEEANQ